MITCVLTLGSRCRKRTRRSRAPSARAASTYSERLSTSTWLRTRRAMPAQPTTPITTNTTGKRRLHRGGDGDEEQEGRKGEGDIGQAHHDGVDPAAVVAGHEPEQRVRASPTTDWEMSPTESESRAPYSTRLRTSRPWESVPRRNRPPGPSR